MIISAEEKVPLEKCPALVLNADFRPLSYYPLSLWCWQDSIKSVFLNRVTIVSNYKRKIRSPSFEMNLPSVIALKNFIKPSVFKNFKLAIDERIKENETLIIDIKSTNKVDILSSKVTKTSININVVFETFQIKALKDKGDKIIDGDINEEILVKDIWVFERKINNDNPNWTLVETKSL